MQVTARFSNINHRGVQRVMFPDLSMPVRLYEHGLCHEVAKPMAKIMRVDVSKWQGGAMLLLTSCPGIISLM
jgi:hypothetical protein